MSPGVANGLSAQASSFLIIFFPPLYHSRLCNHYLKLGQVPNADTTQPCCKCMNRNFTARGCLGNSRIPLTPLCRQENQCFCSPEHAENCPSKEKRRSRVKYNLLHSRSRRLVDWTPQLTIQLLAVQNYRNPPLVRAESELPPGPALLSVLLFNLICRQLWMNISPLAQTANVAFGIMGRGVCYMRKGGEAVNTCAAESSVLLVN